MMSRKTTKVVPIPNPIECFICHSTLTDPKRLWCLHTFCLGCLEEHVKNTPSWSQTTCPICVTKITVPGGGLKSLPDSTFSATLIELDRICHGPSEDQVCAPCTNDNARNGASTRGVAVVQAAVFCVDCDERLCGPCAEAHRKLRPTKSHRVFMLGSKECENVVDIWKQRAPKCKCEKPANIYCPRCSSVLCEACAMAGHRDHQCQKLTMLFIDEKRKSIRDEMVAVSDEINSWRLKEQNLSDEKKQFLENVDSTARAVHAKAKDLLELVNQEREELLKQLDKVKVKTSVEFDNAGDEVDATIAKMESFCNFSKEIFDHGGISETLGLWNTLMERAKELREIATTRKVQLVKTTFIPGIEHQHLVGHMSVNLKNNPPINAIL